jgi:hypothetical protein
MERKAIVKWVGSGTAGRQIKPGSLPCGQADEVSGCPRRVRVIQLAGEAAHGSGEICEYSARLAKGDQSGHTQHSWHNQTHNDPAKA